MKILLRALAVALTLLGSPASAQIYPYYPPPNQSWNATTGVLTLSGSGPGVSSAGNLTVTAGAVLNLVGASVPRANGIPIARIQTALAASDQSRTVTGLSNDGFLVFSGMQTGTYNLYCWVIFDTSAGTNLIASMFNGGTATIALWSAAISPGAVGGVNSFGTNLSFGAPGLSPFADAIINAVVRYSSNTGNSVAFAWASGTSGNAVTVKAGSYCRMVQTG